MAKKTFKDNINPAMNFISQESVDKAEGENSAKEKTIAEVTRRSNKAPEGYKFNPIYVETRSKRLQLLVQPSLHEKLKARAKAEGTSVNDMINTILQDALSEE